MKKKIRVPIALDDDIYNSISEYARVPMDIFDIK